MTTPHALLLIGSAKPAGTSTSEALGRGLTDALTTLGWSCETLHVHRVSYGPHAPRTLCDAVDKTDLIIIATPVYVDSLPALMTQALERIATHRKSQPTPHPCRVTAIINCGFPEASHCDLSLDICEQFSRHAHTQWVGGLAVGEGGAIDGRPLNDLGGMVRHAHNALKQAAEAIHQDRPITAASHTLARKPIIPGRLYTFLAQRGWRTHRRQL